MANTTNITLDGQVLTINPLQVSYLVQYPDGNQAVVLANGKKEYVTFDEFHNLEELNYSAGGGGGQGEDPVAREEIAELQSQVSSMQTALDSTTGQVVSNSNSISGLNGYVVSGYTGKGVSPFDSTNSYYTTGGTSKFQSIADITIGAKTTTFDDSAYKGDTDLTFLNGLPVDYIVLDTDKTSMEAKINFFGVQSMNYILVHHVQNHPLTLSYLYLDDGSDMFYARISANLSGEGWFLIQFDYAHWSASVVYIDGQIEGIAGDIHKDGLLDRVDKLESVSTPIWQGTQAEYDAITTKDNNTLYLINEE